MAPPDPTSFWAQVRLNVVSWLIIVAVGGVGYIGWTVPRLLQVVISGQADLQQQQTETQKLVVGVERRVTVLELRR